MAASALVALTVTAASAQSYRQDYGRSIQVVVNGDPVNFDTIGPRQYNGRVLVPLRGVLEKLGAYVDWDASSQTVIATKEDMKLVLPIGSRFARVNENRVSLDVPAMTIAGSTMVPLRFVSETMGADVRWNDATNTVSIFTGGNSGGFAHRSDNWRDNWRDGRAHRSDSVIARDPRMPVVDSVNTDLTGNWLPAGDRMHITMHATPGGRAFFRIRNIVGEQKMEETSPGLYEAWWRCPDDKDCRIVHSDILCFVLVGDRATAEKHP